MQQDQRRTHDRASHCKKRGGSKQGGATRKRSRFFKDSEDAETSLNYRGRNKSTSTSADIACKYVSYL